MSDWKKGSFTVEAAVIVPMSVFMIALLCGFCYFTHQINWYKGAACESMVYALQKDQSKLKIEQLAKDHMALRMEEQPLNMGETSSSTEVGGYVKIKFEGLIIPDYFGDKFKYEKQETLTIIDPGKIKRTAFVFREVAGV